MAQLPGTGARRDFLGQGWAFPPTFDPRDRSALLVSQVEDVQESLRILLETAPGERVMQPHYGCGIKRLVFEPMNESTRTEMRSLIERAVLFFEARIQLDEVSFDGSDEIEGLLLIRLVYTLRSTNTRHNLVYPLYLQEGSGLRAEVFGGGTGGE